MLYPEARQPSRRLPGTPGLLLGTPPGHPAAEGRGQALGTHGQSTEAGEALQ
jgi:hypothetical protein